MGHHSIAPSAGPADYCRHIGFTLGRSHPGLAGRIYLEAGLYPIAEVPKPSQPAYRAGLAVVIGRYRAVLDALVAAGRLSRVRAYDLGNCRPAVLTAAPATRMCNLAAFCPHCFARRTASYWSRMDSALFSSPEGGGRAGVDLLYTERRFGPEDLGHAAGYTLQDAVVSRLADRQVWPDILGSRSLEMRRLRRKCLWAVEGLVISPAYRRGDVIVVGWKVAIRRLMAVRPELPDAKVIAIPTPDRLQLARAAARLGRYPRGLLLNRKGQLAPAEVIDTYLKTVAGRRLWAAYGDLPSGGSRKNRRDGREDAGDTPGD
jgi:hypothetical protein